MTQLFGNNDVSTLASGIAPGATSLTLQSGAGAIFPSPTGGDFFTVTLYQKPGGTEINHEIVKCTARTGDVLTVVRAQEGTTAKAFNTGDPVELRLTAGALTALAAAAMDLISTSPITAGTATIECSIDPALYAKIVVRILFSGSSAGTLQVQLMGASAPLATNYNATILSTSATTLTNALGTTSITVPGNISTNTSFQQQTTVEATLHEFSTAPFTAALMNISTANVSDGACRLVFGSNTSSAIVKGIQLFPSAGTFQAGSVTVWGVKK